MTRHHSRTSAGTGAGAYGGGAYDTAGDYGGGAYGAEAYGSGGAYGGGGGGRTNWTVIFCVILIVGAIIGAIIYFSRKKSPAASDSKTPASDSKTPPQDAKKPPPQDAKKPPPQDAKKPPPQDAKKPPPQDAKKPPPQDAKKPPPQDAKKPPPQEYKHGAPVYGKDEKYTITPPTGEVPASLTPSNTVSLTTRMSATLNDSQNQQKNATLKFKNAIQAANKSSSPSALLTLYQTMATKARSHAQSCLPFAQNLTSKLPGTGAKALAAYGRCLENEKAALAATDPATAKTAAFAAERARFECSDAVLDLMLIANPTKSLPLPSRSPNITDCMAGSKDSWASTDDSRRLFPEQTRLINYTQTKALELLAYMLKMYPNDPLTINMNTHWSRRVAPFDATNEIVEFVAGDSPWMATNGCKFGKCIGVNMHLLGSPPRCLTRVVHEMCHICTNADGHEGHTPKFYAAERKLLRIATEELGWIVENWRRETCDIAKDPNVKDPNKACPKCTWQEDPVFSSKEVSDGTCRPNGDLPTSPSPDPPVTAAMMKPMAKKVDATMSTILRTTSSKTYIKAQIKRAKDAASKFKATKDPATAAAWNSVVQNAAITITFMLATPVPKVSAYLPY